MGLVLTVTAGLVVWVVLWALGAKGFDAFMLAALIIVGAQRSRSSPATFPAAAAVSAGARAPVRLPSRRRVWRRGRRGRAGAWQLARAAGAASRAPQPAWATSSRSTQPAAAGRLRAVSQQIVNGEKLALYDAGGHVGQLRVSYYSLDDSSPKTGQWDPGITAADAKTAAQDPSTIAYLGDYNSLPPRSRCR